MFNDVRIITWNDDGREKKTGYWGNKKVIDKKSIKSFSKKSGGQLKEGFNKKIINKKQWWKQHINFTNGSIDKWK